MSGFPTIKFIPSGGGEAITYEGGRTEDLFLEFLNKKCGTHRVAGGALSELAGRIPSLDTLASTFFGGNSALARQTILDSATSLATSFATDSSALASYYLKIMNKYVGSVEGAKEWVEKEGERLGKMASKKGAIAGKKLDELRMKQNVRLAFALRVRVEDPSLSPSFCVFTPFSSFFLTDRLLDVDSIVIDSQSFHLRRRKCRISSRRRQIRR